jgi:hypothetical protein
VLKSPRDETISAREEYRNIIAREYDLVLVENGYPLEPNYVIIENVASNVNEEDMINFNVTKVPDVNLNEVRCRKFKQRDNEGSNCCTLVFDFISNSQEARKFADIIKREGLNVDQNNLPSSIVNLRMDNHDYYKFLFTTSRNIDAKFPR